MSVLAVRTCFEAFVKSSVLGPNPECASDFTLLSSCDTDKGKNMSKIKGLWPLKLYENTSLPTDVRRKSVYVMRR